MYFVVIWYLKWPGLIARCVYLPREFSRSGSTPRGKSNTVFACKIASLTRDLPSPLPSLPRRRERNARIKTPTITDDWTLNWSISEIDSSRMRYSWQISLERQERQDISGVSVNFLAVLTWVLWDTYEFVCNDHRVIPSATPTSKRTVTFTGITIGHFL